MRRHYERQRNSPDSASKITPTDNSWGRFSHITPLPTPTPDSAEEYRQLISEQETKFLAPTLPPRHLNSAERGRGRFRSKSSLDSVEELNETLEVKKQKVHRKVDSRTKFRPLSPSHMRRQFDPSVSQVSPQSAGGYAVKTVFGAQEKEFGHMRARFRPNFSPVDDGEYQRLIDGQRREMGLSGNGVKRESMDSFKKLYDQS